MASQLTDQNSQFRQGSVQVQIALLLLLVVAVGLYFYLQGQITQILLDIQLMLYSDPQQALRIISRLLLWLVVTSGLISLAVAFYLCLMAARIGRCGEYPPPQMPVAFRTRIRRGTPAMRMKRSCLLLGALLFCQPLGGVLLWYGITGGVI
ncbi:hypothetical protein DV711_01025 [Motiliproteus coralliicola]|uniref:Uncharacterized protein n=1 Tax=Motiliproteus coralliicola TaxID=2283196 RepID=A0A369WR95_9GAMM|nr:hypothetical protein [Motiliproteus coralliicola]RDE24212.1 hypothetical protein DV711_01025 [Motiliproteus coralliicola]